MKQFTILGIFITASLLKYHIFADSNCLEIVNSTESIYNCCKIPQTGDSKIEEEVLKNHPEIDNSSHELGSCLFAQYYMQKLNLTQLKSEDIKNYIRIIFKGPEWIEAMDRATDQCLEIQPKYVKTFQNHYKIADEQCDLKYQTFMVCMNLFAYKECPPKDLINIDKCKSTKQFLESCASNGDAIISYVQIRKI